ncbi:MAG TPA: DUF6263 family protein [Gemmatimonadaceae bacterium]|nr:DUF6263 family protein [Gemmatimonadaceae bacterium]
MHFRNLRHLAAVALVIASAVLGTNAGAQPVLLQLRPRIGDTLRMHMSQTVEMTGTMPGTAGDSTRSMTTTIEVFTRAIAKQWTSGGTLMHAITDSVAMTPSSPGSLADLKRYAGQSKSVVLRVSPDGAVEMVDDGDPHSELRRIFGGMPATLARQAVAIGEKWSREMQIPLTGQAGAMGTVRATFQLDSLGRNGDLAYISMKGSMSRVNLPGVPGSSAGYETSGTLAGTMQVDRRLGWITESRTTINVRSTISSLPDRGRKAGAPMLVRTKITQWIRAMRAR